MQKNRLVTLAVAACAGWEWFVIHTHLPLSRNAFLFLLTGLIVWGWGIGTVGDQLYNKWLEKNQTTVITRNIVLFSAVIVILIASWFAGFIIDFLFY
jgi:hypothetical protein